MTQFLRDEGSDSEEVLTPLMLDGTYLSRNFATLGPFLTLQPPCLVASCLSPVPFVRSSIRFSSRYLRSLPSHVIHSVHSAEPVRRTEVNGGEWHAHERREQRTEASGLLTALTSVPWSSCSVHRVSFPPSLRPPSHSIRLRHVVESERSEHGTE
jgi:hypothetical protein